MRVLIADDQRNFAIALADMVRYCGHEVVAVVGSGLEAIHAFTLHKPDLLLMDYRMPKLNGATACRHILAKNPAARIVLLSAWSPLDGSDKSGAMCFLAKPVELARLNATLLTISQSIAPPAAFEENYLHSNSGAAHSNTIVPFVPIPIPQEIISPIEHFPTENFPATDACLDKGSEGEPIPQEKISRKRRAPRKKRAGL